MENSPLNLATDLWASLVDAGHPITRPEVRVGDQGAAAHGTTVIAVKFDGGVLNIGDRRATANFAVMFDRAEKVLSVDDYSLIAISGSFARATEVVRYLRTAFRLFERTYLQPMSLDGKLAELARVVRAGVPEMLQGIGGFIPLFSTFDVESGEGRIFFYDGMGARFENTEYAAAGSGAVQIRGAFDYIARTRKPFHAMSLEEALAETLLLLDIASDLDAATGGWGKVPPVAMTITAAGVADVPATVVANAMRATGQVTTKASRGAR